ncbi:hypothetical protein [Thermoflavimicrobium daqui]|uniref:Lipoprotein n=1 Tax=Thermoflavimicrobium daqui TaxID=2137476 RepID=A0A364K9C2_9BACL|nr:hypothetical protein [Thermoflavimicrobium daqui]RAL26891.1 hypothetical protein DL897_02255 [Thermoflavimicrobium daqui]
MKRIIVFLFVCILSVIAVACSGGTIKDGDHVLTSNGDYILYKNEKYKFNAKLPESWDDVFQVKSNTDKAIPEKLETITFELKNENAPIFTIGVFNIPSKSAWDQKELANQWEYLTTKNGKTLAIMQSTEPPASFFDESGNVKEDVKEKLSQLDKMINDELPNISKSIQFE